MSLTTNINIDEALELIESNPYVEEREWDRTWGLAVHYWINRCTALQSFRGLLQDLSIEGVEVPTRLDKNDSEPQIIIQKKDDRYILNIQTYVDAQLGPGCSVKTIDENFAYRILNMVKSRGYLLYDARCQKYYLE